MKVTIIRDDGVVGVDGEFRTVDLSALDPAIHALHWDSVVGEGEVEYVSPRRNEEITDFTPYQQFHDAWVAAAPPPPTLDDLKDIKSAEFNTEGVSRIAAQVADWDSVATIKTVAGLWPAISGTATAAQLKAKDIYLYVRDTVPPKIAAITTEAELALVDPTVADPFGDGTPWPT